MRLSDSMADTLSGGRPEHYIFPFHKMGMAGNERTAIMYDLALNRPTGSWRKAWIDAQKVAGVRYRWHVRKAHLHFSAG